jgi:predicted anti-sigma-YlaC factor YlaD
MLSCRYATRLLSQRLDRSLRWFERLPLFVHLLGCGPCRRFRWASNWLHHALPAATHDDVLLPPDARERIGRALEQATQESEGSL